MTIGEAIRARRRELGWTLMQLAARCGVTYQWLSEIERGAEVHTSTLTKVLEALGMRLTVEVCDG